MKPKIKKAASVLSAALLFGGVFAGCDFDPWKSVTIGDFVYSTNQKGDSGDGYDYAIIGLSEEGKQKDTLVFPSFADGHKIVSIGADFVKRTREKFAPKMRKKSIFAVILAPSIRILKNRGYVSIMRKYS